MTARNILFLFAVAVAWNTLVVVASSSSLISETGSRLPMGLSTVISDLEAEGCTHLTTACFMASRSVTKAQRANLLETLFGLDNDNKKQLASSTAFGKKIFDDDDDGLALAHPGREASASEVASTVVACGGTVVYVPSPVDLSRGEGLFDALAPSMERLLSKKSSDTTDRKAVLVVVVTGDMVEAKIQLEHAASLVLATIVQPNAGKKATVLEDVFDAVEYLSASASGFEDTLCHLGGACEPAEAAASVAAAAAADFNLASVVPFASTTLSDGCSPQDLAAARLLGPAALAALASALQTVADASTNPQTGETQLVTNFGELCDAAVSRAMAEFDETQQPKTSSLAKTIRSNLKDELYAELSDKFEEQLEQLRVSCFDEYRRKLSQLKISPNLATDMDQAASDSVAAFVTAAKKLKAKGASSSSWSFRAAKTAYAKSLSDYGTDRLLVARASGQFRPVPRKGVTVGLHWLLPKPFGNDFRQEPWMVQALDNLVYVPKDKITDVTPQEVQAGDWRRKVVPNPSGNEMLYM